MAAVATPATPRAEAVGAAEDPGGGGHDTDECGGAAIGSIRQTVSRVLHRKRRELARRHWSGTRTGFYTAGEPSNGTRADEVARWPSQ